MATLTGARLDEANLTGADLRGAKGLRFDANLVRDIHIRGDAPDPWSVLRRSYTGPRFFVHFALLVAFVLPYAGKVLALTAAGHAFEWLRSREHLPDLLAHPVQSLPTIAAWRVLVGLDKSAWVPLLGGVLLLYNIIRAVLTIQVGQLRDAEERSGRTPTLPEYMGTQALEDEGFWRALLEIGRELARTIPGVDRRPSETDTPRKDILRHGPFLTRAGLWRLHRVLRALLYFAVLSFACHAVDWIATTRVPSLPPSSVPSPPDVPISPGPPPP